MNTPNALPLSAPTPARRRLFLVIALLAVFGLGAGTTAWMLRDGSTASPARDAHGHGPGEKEGEAAQGNASATAPGPHGGELFTQGDFSLELLLQEAEGQAHYKAWLYDKKKPLAPTDSSVTLSLKRPNGERQEIVLAPEGQGAGDALGSAQAVPEPHVFEATAAIRVGGGAGRTPHEFRFSRQDGLIEMTQEQTQAAAIALEASAAAPIRSVLKLPGEIRFNEDRTAHIVPRVAGVVDSVNVNLGQAVKKGQVLATLSSQAVSEIRAELQASQKRLELARTTYEREKKLWEEKISPQQDVLQAQQVMREAQIATANASQKLNALGATPNAGALGRIELRAPFDAIVVEKHISMGEAVREDANVFTLSDLSSVWAEISVAARDLPQVRVGEAVTVRSGAFDATAKGQVSYVGSLIGSQTRTAPARATLANPQGAWRPGLYVDVELVAGETQAPVTVPAAAIQTLEEQPTVFIQVPDGFVPQPVKLGRSDGQRVEIVRGLQAGAVIATEGSFVLKSEQGKGAASHGH